jgi:hypothetical protein
MQAKRGSTCQRSGLRHIPGESEILNTRKKGRHSGLPSPSEKRNTNTPRVGGNIHRQWLLGMGRALR